MNGTSRLLITKVRAKTGSVLSQPPKSNVIAEIVG